MPLILAIEPDRRQAAQLSVVVRRRVGAELILVSTTEQALDAIGNRVPDLVLIPALLSPQDDAALAAALRVIAAAARVQLLTIPVLGGPRPASRAGGVLSALRRDRSRSAEPDGCDPTVFAEQIASYLERAAQERASVAADVAADVAVEDTPPPAESVVEDTPPPAESVIEAVINDFADPDPAAEPFVTDIVEPSLATVADDRVPPRPDPAAEPFVTDFVEPPLAAGADDGVSLPRAWAAEPSATDIVEPPLAAAADDGVSLALEEAMRALFVESAAASAPHDEELSSPPFAAVEPATEPAIGAEPATWATEPATGAIEPATGAIEPATGAIEPATGDLWAANDLIAVLELMPLAAIEATERGDWALPRTEEHKDAVEEPASLLEKPASDNGGLTKDVKVEESPVHPEPSTVAVKSELEWVALIDSLRHDVERLRTERSEKPSPRPPVPRSTRPGKKTKPVQDEWGLFDPEQCGFAALLAKLEEVTESEEAPRI